ncbi:MAG: response regulator [Desulfobacterales bacterium]|jgi:DNA-binding NtrC family response regulator
MWETDTIKGKQILIVDDELDILESLEEALEVCKISKASTFEAAKEMLEAKQYDAAILDIMGVRGYDLLQIAVSREIPAIMLTAHALTADDFIKSMKSGAYAYIPKDEMADITYYLADTLRARQERSAKPRGWFAKLESYFAKKFGPDWLDSVKDLWVE